MRGDGGRHGRVAAELGHERLRHIEGAAECRHQDVVGRPPRVARIDLVGLVGELLLWLIDRVRDALLEVDGGVVYGNVGDVRQADARVEWVVSDCRVVGVDGHFECGSAPDVYWCVV